MKNFFNNYTKTTTRFLVVFVFFILSRSVYAAVVINEIAWMGTVNNVNDEWIELYNNGTETVNLDGWVLTAADGSPNIPLSGTISAGGYVLLERTDDNVIPGIKALVIYSGALSNAGEYLKLKDNKDAVVDEIDGRSKDTWIKGNADSKQTMQRNNGEWITAVATPGAVNATTDTSSSTSSGSGSSSSGTGTTGSGSGSTSTPTTTVTATESTDTVIVYRDPIYTARMILPEMFVATSPAMVSAIVTQDNKFKLISGKYEWSMGDGTNYLFYENKPFTHTYKHPGTYIVGLKYYASLFNDAQPSTLHRRTITVIPDAVYIQNVENGNITLKNMSTDTVDLSGWSITTYSNSSQMFTFGDTLLPKDSEITLESSDLRFYPKSVSDVILKNPLGRVVKKPIPQVSPMSSSVNISDALNNSRDSEISSITNPYDNLPAGIPVSLLDDVTLAELETINPSNTPGKYLSASVSELSSTLKTLIRSGKGPLVMLGIIILIISILFFSVYGLVEQKEDEGVNL